MDSNAHVSLMSIAFSATGSSDKLCFIKALEKVLDSVYWNGVRDSSFILSYK